MSVVAMPAAIGCNIGVRLEDLLCPGPGRLADTNARQVTMAREIIKNMTLAVATPDEARAILSLKGADRTILLPT